MHWQFSIVEAPPGESMLWEHTTEIKVRLMKPSAGVACDDGSSIRQKQSIVSSINSVITGNLVVTALNVQAQTEEPRAAPNRLNVMQST